MTVAPAASRHGNATSLDLRGRPFDPRQSPLRFSTDSLWGFLLEELPGRRTRLVVSGYWTLRPRWLQPVASIVVLEPTHWIMQTRQFANLKRHAERDAERPPVTEHRAGGPDGRRGGRPAR